MRNRTMNRAFSRMKILAVIGVMLVAACVTAPASAELMRHSEPGDLFYNYYAPPVGASSVGAGLYPCPRPTPPFVGHTYITYQPLMPHEFLYKHHRMYVTKHEDAPPTVTTVRWR
jgi:hypothetical protein